MKKDKTKTVLMACAEVETELDDFKLQEAEAKLMNLCGALAEGTKYKKEIDRLGEKYLDVLERKMFK
ncbi:hypothetical protein C1147_07940 [Clostridium botulinum]|nr:hypothetical protein C1147_07940 [Clostridium botulinum]